VQLGQGRLNKLSRNCRRPDLLQVHPKKLDIPPHEYRYVTVYFSPKAIKSFVATFEAIVENGGNPKTERFECEVRGEGTLPTLTLEQPALRDNKGQPWLKFPRVLKGKKHTATMLLKNNGIIAASGRLDFTSHKVCPGHPVTFIILKALVV
jgi:hydrocephalus-inducing protein